MQVEGICLYPVANHPGWDDDRLCPNGLLGHDPSGGSRSVEWSLAQRVMQTGHHPAHMEPAPA